MDAHNIILFFVLLVIILYECYKTKYYIIEPLQDDQKNCTNELCKADAILEQVTKHLNRVNAYDKEATYHTNTVNKLIKSGAKKKRSRAKISQQNLKTDVDNKDSKKIVAKAQKNKQSE